MQSTSAKQPVQSNSSQYSDQDKPSVQATRASDLSKQPEGAPPRPPSPGSMTYSCGKLACLPVYLSVWGTYNAPHHAAAPARNATQKLTQNPRKSTQNPRRSHENPTKVHAKLTQNSRKIHENPEQRENAGKSRGTRRTCKKCSANSGPVSRMYSLGGNDPLQATRGLSESGRPKQASGL